MIAAASDESGGFAILLLGLLILRWTDWV